MKFWIALMVVAVADACKGKGCGGPHFPVPPPIGCRTPGGCGPHIPPPVDCKTLGGCGPHEEPPVGGGLFPDFGDIDIKQLLIWKALLGGNNGGGGYTEVCRRELIVDPTPAVAAPGGYLVDVPKLFATTCQSGEDALRNNDGSYRYCGLERGGRRCPRGTECTSNENGDFYLCCPSVVSLRVPAPRAPSRHDGAMRLFGAAQPGARYIVTCD